MKKHLLVIVLCAPCFLFGSTNHAVIERVVDGDTLLVTIKDTVERVRIIGIDTPEIVAQNRPVECFGQEASNYAKQILSPGSRVTVSQNGRDKYDRVLAYIETVDKEDFGLRMISDGYAYAYRTYPHERMRQYVTAERQARINQRGLWSVDTCRSANQSQETIRNAWKGYFEIILSWFRLFVDLVF